MVTIFHKYHQMSLNMIIRVLKYDDCICFCQHARILEISSERIPSALNQTVLIEGSFRRGKIAHLDLG